MTATPTAEQLFQVRPYEEKKLLPEDQERMFNQKIVQMLFICANVKRQIKNTAGFLTARVKYSY